MIKLNILRKNITAAIIISVVLILLLYTFLSFIFVKNYSNVVDQNMQKLTIIEQSNEEYLEELDLKSELAKIIKDVNYTSVLVLEYLETEDQDINHRREKVWLKRILPNLDSLDKKMDKSTSDYSKLNFNKLYDEINNNKLRQSRVLEQFRTDTLGSYLIDLSEMKKSVDILSDNYSSFLSSKPVKPIVNYDFVRPWQENSLSRLLFSVAIFVLIIFIVLSLIRFVSTPIQNTERFLLEIRSGSFPEDSWTDIEDFSNISSSLNGVKEKLTEIQEFAKHVANSDFTGQKSLQFNREGELGVALVSMQETLERIAKQDRERNHINIGLERFSEVLSSYTNNLEDFGDIVIKELVKFLNANQGAFYVTSESNDEIKMVSCYAYEKKKYINQTLKKGQGLVGQVWQEGKPLYLTEVPKDYFNITSGLGNSSPRSILIVPLMINDVVHGIMELASFNLLEDYEQGFVEKVTESISAALASVKINTKTQELLKESSALTSQMRKQEDEMMDKVKELNQSQEETRQREVNYIKEINRLKRKLEMYERNI